MDAGDLDPDPMEQLRRWLVEARDCAEPYPYEMAVATSTVEGVPSARMVILRGHDDGLVFFTDFTSQKGRELLANPVAAAVLHWHAPVHRQVRVSGAVAPVADAEADTYWATRPPGSRRSAVSSHQSAVVVSREVLEDAAGAVGERYPDDDAVPRPERWSGFRLTPAVVEFWEEGADRLHDRIRYRSAGGGAGWVVERLSP
jgi:pyridoxamine 5'-phosphate oxidase